MNTDALKLKLIALYAHLQGLKKHSFRRKPLEHVRVDNVVYLRNAASVAMCYKCGTKINLIGRDLNSLTFNETYGCPSIYPIDPKDPKEKNYGNELRPAS